MLYEIGVKLCDHKDFKEAIYIFDQFLKDEDTEIDQRIGAYFYLSVCYSDIDQRKRVYYLLKGMEYDRTRPELCCSLAIYYMDQNQFRRAIPLLLAATKREMPQESSFFIEEYWNYTPYLELSVCYDRLQEIQKAYVFNELAGASRPDSTSVQYNRDYYNSLLASQDGSLEAEKKRIIERRIKYQDLELDGVSIISVTNKQKYIDTIFENYNRIKYPKKELIIILNSNKLDLELVKQRGNQDDSIQVYQLDEEITLGECLNYGIQKSSFQYIAKMDDDDFYGENYILDGVIESKEYNVDIIVKSKRLMFFERDSTFSIYRGWGENTIVPGGGGGTILAKRSVFDKVLFEPVNIAEDDAFFSACAKHGIRVYSGSRFNYVYYRHSVMEDNSFVIGEHFFKRYCEPVKEEMPPEVYASV